MDVFNRHWRNARRFPATMRRSRLKWSGVILAIVVTGTTISHSGWRFGQGRVNSFGLAVARDI